TSFFTTTPMSESYTPSLHDALPICVVAAEDRRHPRIDVRHVLADLPQLLAHQRSAVVGAHGHQLRLAAGEVDHLQRAGMFDQARSEEHTSELQSRENLVCRLLLEKK